MARRSNTKRRVDPNAPKKPAAAWRLFFTENREEITKQNPGSSYAEISTKLGEIWRQIDPNNKRRYEKQYQSSQTEYDEKLANYRTEQKNKKQQSKKNNNDETSQS